MIRDLLLELKQEKKCMASGSKSQVTWKEYRDAAATLGRKLMCPKLSWGLMQARNMGDNKKSFIK